MPDQTRTASSDRKADLRQLGRLAGPCFSTQNHHLMIENGTANLRPSLRDGKIRVTDFRDTGTTLRPSLERTLDSDLQPFQFLSIM